MNLLTIKDYLDIAANVALIFALLIAYIEYRSTRAEATRNYTTEIYHTLDEKYVDWLALCFDNSNLSIWDLDDDTHLDGSTEEGKKRLIAFEMLICIFERAFTTYHDQSESRARFWAGWDAYIRSFLKRKDFTYAWSKFGFSYDAKFQQYMNGIIEDP